jgi:hypothetical protein
MSDTVSINLRLPSDLHWALKDEAEQERRSLNSEIVHRLTRHPIEIERLRSELAGMSDVGRKVRDHNNEMFDVLHRAIAEAVGWDPKAAWPGNRAAIDALAKLRERAEAS